MFLTLSFLLTILWCCSFLRGSYKLFHLFLTIVCKQVWQILLVRKLRYSGVQ